MVANKKFKYPDRVAHDFVVKRLDEKGVSLEAIAEEARLQQLSHNDKLTFEDCFDAVQKVLWKREILNNIMVALELDRMATEGLLAEPLQSIIANDSSVMSVDEGLALSISMLYGEIAQTNFSYLDVVKHGLSKKLDNSHEEVNTFVDDIVSALIACTEAKVAHKYE